MATELKRFSGPYATMTVATYEPLIIQWISFLTLRNLSMDLALRYPKAKLMVRKEHFPTAYGLNETLRPRLPMRPDLKLQDAPKWIPLNHMGLPMDPDALGKAGVKGFPGMMASGSQAIVSGAVSLDPSAVPAMEHMSKAWGMNDLVRSAVKKAADSFGSLMNIPVLLDRRMVKAVPGINVHDVKMKLEQTMYTTVRDWVKAGAKDDLMVRLSKDLHYDGIQIPHFWPWLSYEMLSPIGVAHYYRQLYFNLEEGVGPVEEAFTVAPLETLEVLYQTVRRQIHEEVLEQGLESVSESATEEKNLDEVSDKVSSMMQMDSSASMSANASGGIGVWSVCAEASASLNTSSQNSRELSTRRLKEMTKRASERITKSFSIKTTDSTDTTTTSSTRRVIRNDGADPVSYGLRRVLRRVQVKVQDLGPRLVWQLYLRDPGHGLARSKFVLYRDAQPIAVPDVPPGVPPRPIGGSDTGSVSTSIIVFRHTDGVEYYAVEFVIKPGPDRDITGVRVDSMTDLEGGGKDDEAPAPHNEVDLGSLWNPATRTFTARIAILPGDSATVQLNYTYNYSPSQAVLDAWELLRADAASKITESAMIDQFEQQKNLITQRSRIRPRPANDLRKEERYEVMNRMVDYLFGRGDELSEPTPLEIEQFHRFFDIDGMFTYNHPSWWKPRFQGKGLVDRMPYEITSESEPAALGSSLGWALQLDGDHRRNEFLNSAWARVCLPIKPGLESQALAWLREHLEGDAGYNDTSGPLKRLIDDIAAFRKRERDLDTDSADYVTVDSTPGAPVDPLKPEGVYPIVQEFDVTVPTEGFVYDRLNVVTP